jgi:hypothetical protein
MISMHVVCLALNIDVLEIVATLLWGECEDETHTPEMGTWESFETPKCLKFDWKGQNSSS